MFRLFKKKYVYPELKWPSYAREMTEYEKRFVVNGGSERRENSHEGVAGANVGDTIQRNDGTIVTLNQGDIDYARKQLGINGGGSGSSGGSSGSSGSGSGSGSSGGSSGSGSSGSSADTTPKVDLKKKAQADHKKNIELMNGWYENSTISHIEKSKNKITGAAISGNKIEGSSSVSAKMPTQQVRDLKHVYIPSEGVGYGNVSVQTTYFSDENGKLNVSTSSSYSDRFNRESVSEYEYFGNVTLLKDGKEVEKKPIIRPEGDIVYDSRYDYIGTATFDYPIDSYSNYSIKSDINLVVNRFPWKMKFEHEVNR